MSSYQDVYYTASLIEYIGRATLNHRSDVAKAIGVEGISHLIKIACVNHCLSFAQVSDEIISQYDIQKGTYDSVGNCRYKVPSYTAIGKVFARLVEDLSSVEPSLSELLYEVFTSEISDMITDFNGTFFFAPRSEILATYREMK